MYSKVLISLKSIAFDPICGKVPLVFIGFPPKVIVVIFLVFLSVKSMKNIFVLLGLKKKNSPNKLEEFLNG